MRSTFGGFEIARRGLFAQQSAIQTTGHNIANANTPGYSRQRVNFSQTNPYPIPGLSATRTAGQYGTGVEVESVTRIRNQFLDQQYRIENSKSGYWSSRSTAMSDIEEIMNEPSEHGLASTLNNFWKSMQDLVNSPEGGENGGGARASVRQRGMEVAETFRYLHSSIDAIRGNVKDELNVTKDQINSIVDQISQLNQKISDVEVHGYLPNDLYDKRDALVDELSKIVNIRVKPETSGGNSLPMAVGSYKIDIVDEKGEPLATLVDKNSYNQVNLVEENNRITNITVGVEDTPSYKEIAPNATFQGEFQGLIESWNDTYPKIQSDLDEMAYTFVTNFNAIHKAGYGIGENAQNGISFFKELTSKEGAAASLEISAEIEESIDNIAAAEIPNVSGDRKNAQKLANLFKEPLNFNNSNTTVLGFYSNIIGNLGVDGQKATRLSDSSELLKQSIDTRRMSENSVSLDEEMTNLIQFQHAYNASARMITIQDELIDKIINGMGHAGR